MSYQSENDKLLNSFLERTFFKGFKYPREYPNWSRLELYMNTRCNQNCKYCYLARYGAKLYPEFDQDKVIKNTRKLLHWLDYNDFHPNLELFSGEPLVQSTGFKVIDMVLEHKISSLIIPTNFSFMLDDKLVHKVEERILAAKNRGIRLFLSASIDGKYCEENRPLKGYEIDPRDDSFYDKVFGFCSKYNYGFHPMVYSELIENWCDNFLWFQDMFKKHKIPWWNLYLLEVRNKEWTKEQIVELGNFIKFLVRWVYNKTGKDGFVNFVFRGKGFNILSNPLTRVGRGIGCSIQSVMCTRLQDLAIFPCHRTSYPQFKVAQFDENMNIRAYNPDLWITILTLDANTLPYCETCPVKHLCGKGCLGSQYEVTGDLFTPIPTVCEMEHWKLYSYIEALKEIEMLDTIKNTVELNKRNCIEFLEGEIKK